MPTDWEEGSTCRVVEHDDATRQPKPGGRVAGARVLRTTKVYVTVTTQEYGMVTFYRSSGWATWDGQFRWRLMPADAETATAAGEEATGGQV